MIPPSQHATFLAYAITCLALCANLLALWIYSGILRGGAKASTNPEDVATFGATLVPSEPPAIARALRAHGNANASIPPFLFLGGIYVAAGGPTLVAIIVFGTFTLARLAHSACYLRAMQPGRTASFAIGMLATLGLFGAIIFQLLR